MQLRTTGILPVVLSVNGRKQTVFRNFSCAVSRFMIFSDCSRNKLEQQYISQRLLWSMENNRKLHLDLLRMIAIFLVIYNHTGITGCSYYYDIHDSFWHWPLMEIAFVMRSCIPVFFMISGALLLGRNESLKDLYRKRILRFLIVLIAASMITYLYNIREDFSQFSLWSFFYTLYSYEHSHSYWFLYQYLGWLMCLPLLRKMAQAMEDRDFFYLIIVALAVRLMTFVPIAFFGDPSSTSRYFTLFLLDNTVLFPLLGYYMEQRMPDSAFNRKNAMILLAVFAAASIITLAAQNYWCSTVINWELGGSEGYMLNLGFIPAIVLFYFSKSLFLNNKASRLWQKTITLFGSCSFGLYLFQHIYLIELDDMPLRNIFGTYFGTVLWVVEICILGTAVAFVLKQIPGVKKLL